MLTALVLSGFPTDRFVFEGFLPAARDGAARAHRRDSCPRRAPSCSTSRPAACTPPSRNCWRACGPLREVAVARELTKLHQEVWRGPLDEAVGHVELTEPRGEHVIVLAPAPPAPEANDDEIDAHVTAALAEGLSTRDAAARVARDLKVPRRRTYDAATRLKPKRP